MKIRSITLLAMCLFLVTAIYAAAPKADFTGTWVMDSAKSEGVPEGMEQTMTVKQTGDKIDQETKVMQEQGDQTVSSVYMLDGKEVEYPVKRQIGEGKGKRIAKWAADGNGFEVSEEETVETPNGAVVLKFARKWVMAPDAKSLTIDLDVTSPNGPIHTKRIFVKK